MRAGQLYDTLILQGLVSAVDEIGQPVTTWEAIAELPANIGYESGMSAIKSGADTSIVKASIMIRPRAGITAAMRGIDKADGTVFAIQAAIPDKRRRDRMYLTCQVVT